MGGHSSQAPCGWNGTQIPHHNLAYKVVDHRPLAMSLPNKDLDGKGHQQRSSAWQPGYVPVNCVARPPARHRPSLSSSELPGG